MTEEEWLSGTNAALLLRCPALAESPERQLAQFFLEAGLIDSVELASWLRKFVEGSIDRSELDGFFRWLVPHRRPVKFTAGLASEIVAVRSGSRDRFPILLRDIFGNPFRSITADPAWRTPTVQSIAAAIYEDRAFDRLPILADALEEAGCTNADVLLHCRQPAEHVRGCWVVDLMLGKT